MGELMLILLAIGLGILILIGHCLILDAAFGNYVIDWSEDGGVILFAVVADLILLCLVIIKIKTPVSSSFQLMRNGLKNRKIAKKRICKTKEAFEK